MHYNLFQEPYRKSSGNNCHLNTEERLSEAYMETAPVGRDGCRDCAIVGKVVGLVG